MVLVDAGDAESLSVALRHPPGQNFAVPYPAHVDARDTKSGRKVGDYTLQIVQTDDVNDVCPIDGQIEVIPSDNGSREPSMTPFQRRPNKRYIEHTRR